MPYAGKSPIRSFGKFARLKRRVSSRRLRRNTRALERLCPRPSRRRSSRGWTERRRTSSPFGNPNPTRPRSKRRGVRSWRRRDAPGRRRRRRVVYSGRRKSRPTTTTRLGANRRRRRATDPTTRTSSLIEARWTTASRTRWRLSGPRLPPTKTTRLE